MMPSHCTILIPTKRGSLLVFQIPQVIVRILVLALVRAIPGKDSELLHCNLEMHLLLNRQEWYLLFSHRYLLKVKYH